ncbi:hypothetical protein K504DRAFT_505794 [Pleomassaria siparia CBS 279.74]|uniref:Alb1-domain-containing protein n=1 Tax=Pleomassaria siparia CBS 279.74 TaxID=1314801 RepID=A0A6G1K0M5_9PLEO|nr:hypothetical protein K504DRAFT_505794 [Pleomassaria siparia CBS 279.74]
MAKTGKMKKKQSTIHSRAARRAVSPSINLDKSVKSTTRDSSPPKTKTSTSIALGARPTGITKSKSKSKPLKRQQRVRRERGLERAVDVMDKREVKVQKSVVKEKKVVERKKGWEEVNVEKGRLLGLAAGKKGNAFEALEGQKGDVEGREWVSDEEMPEIDGGEVQVYGDVEMVPVASEQANEVVAAESVSLSLAVEDELL